MIKSAEHSQPRLDPFHNGLDVYKRQADIRSLTEIPILHDLLSFCEQIDLFIQNALVGSTETIRQLSAAVIQNLKMTEIFDNICLSTLYLYLEDVLAHSFTADDFAGFVKELHAAASELSHIEPLRNFDITVIKDFVHQNYAKDVSKMCIRDRENSNPPSWK